MIGEREGAFIIGRCSKRQTLLKEKKKATVSDANAHQLPWHRFTVSFVADAVVGGETMSIKAKQSKLN